MLITGSKVGIVSSSDVTPLISSKELLSVTKLSGRVDDCTYTWMVPRRWNCQHIRIKLKRECL